MRKMNEEDKQKIMQQVELFRREKLTFDSEVAKWDDTGNDIIYLAKHMCMIMMEMTDFTRGRGPLKTTMDVINAAKKISEAGTKLDKLTREIADQCPESSTKKDLLAYLQRIALYCHQIQITSKVKADVQNISGELIVSGVSWTSMEIRSTSKKYFLIELLLITAGQRHITDSSSKESDECSRVHRQVFIRRIHKIYQTRDRCGECKSGDRFDFTANSDREFILIPKLNLDGKKL